MNWNFLIDTFFELFGYIMGTEVRMSFFRRLLFCCMSTNTCWCFNHCLFTTLTLRMSMRAIGFSKMPKIGRTSCLFLMTAITSFYLMYIFLEVRTVLLWSTMQVEVFTKLHSSSTVAVLILLGLQSNVRTFSSYLSEEKKGRQRLVRINMCNFYHSYFYKYQYQVARIGARIEKSSTSKKQGQF